LPAVHLPFDHFDPVDVPFDGAGAVGEGQPGGDGGPVFADREVIEFFIDEDLAEFGDNSLVARTRRWVLRGGGPAPISYTDWSRFDGDGPPSAARLAAESTASEPPLYRPTQGMSSTGPGSFAGHSPPNPETSYRYASPWDAATAPIVAEERSVTVTMCEICGN
jgi:hypothetical protein